MSRLQHSAAGYRRRLQISAVEVVVLVEGKTDRYFYSKVFKRVQQTTGASIKIRIARELPSASGGKKALLSYFNYLRRKRSLVSTLGNKTTLVVFVLDKDTDDLCRRMSRSEYIKYTEYYDYENYLYQYGDVVDAGAAASGLEPELVEQALGDSQRWRIRVQQEWLVWTHVCVFSVTRKLCRGGNYGVIPSPINHHPYGGVDPQKLSARMALMQAEYGKYPQSFVRSWRRVEALVGNLMRAGTLDKVFKGKWYSWFLAQELRMVAGGRDANLTNLESRLPNHLAQSVDVDAPWAKSLQDWLTILIVKSGLSVSSST